MESHVLVVKERTITRTLFNFIYTGKVALFQLHFASHFYIYTPPSKTSLILAASCGLSALLKGLPTVQELIYSFSQEVQQDFKPAILSKKTLQQT